MSSGIFLLQDNGNLVEMKEQAYDTEKVLQELIEKYPNLLAGDQIDESTPRRWLLVSREIGVPGEEDGGDRWYLDHLFLDQDAIPTLIEVKRHSDTRIRREVVGQMLDYAANAIVYWPVETIRARFAHTCESQSKDPAKALGEFLSSEAAGEEFWQKVKTNLQAGRIRMVFVADEIPRELKRIVEFLNEQMDPAEVLAIEIRQFVGQGLKTLVPRVIGQTVKAEINKGSTTRVEKQWDEDTFIEALRLRRGEAEVQTARALLEWARRNGLRIWWGKGSKDGSFFSMLDHNGEEHWVTSVWTYGRVEIPFQHMLTRRPFGDETQREELRARLNRIAGVEIPADGITRRPPVPLMALANDAALRDFLAVLDWYVAQVRRAT